MKSQTIILQLICLVHFIQKCELKIITASCHAGQGLFLQCSLAANSLPIIWTVNSTLYESQRLVQNYPIIQTTSNGLKFSTIDSSWNGTVFQCFTLKGIGLRVNSSTIQLLLVTSEILQGKLFQFCVT